MMKCSHILVNMSAGTHHAPLVSQPTSKTELWRGLQEAWENIPAFAMGWLILWPSNKTSTIIPFLQMHLGVFDVHQ